MICVSEVRHNKIANSVKKKKTTTDVFILVYQDGTCFESLLRTGSKSRLNSTEEKALKRALDYNQKLNATHPEGKRPLGSPRRRWECNRHVKTDVNYTGSDGVD